MPNRTLIRALVVLAVSNVLAIVLVLLFYEGDKLVAIGIIGGAATVVTTQLLSFRQSSENAQAIKTNTELTAIAADEVTRVKTQVAVVADKADNITTRIDGRMDELLAIVRRQGETQAALDAAMAMQAGIDLGRLKAAEEQMITDAKINSAVAAVSETQPKDTDQV